MQHVANIKMTDGASHSLSCHGSSDRCGLVTVSPPLWCKRSHLLTIASPTQLFLYRCLLVVPSVSTEPCTGATKDLVVYPEWEQVRPLKSAGGRTHRCVVYAMLFTNSPHSPLSGVYSFLSTFLSYLWGYWRMHEDKVILHPKLTPSQFKEILSCC